MEEMFSFLVFSTATCRGAQPRGRMEERKGGRAPLGVKDRRRDGAALEVAMREIKKKSQFLCFHCEKESRMEKQRPQHGNTASSRGCNRGYQPLKALFTMTTVNTNTTWLNRLLMLQVGNHKLPMLMHDSTWWWNCLLWFSQLINVKFIKHCGLIFHRKSI